MSDDELRAVTRRAFRPVFVMDPGTPRGEDPELDAFRDIGQAIPVGGALRNFLLAMRRSRKRDSRTQ
jgi:hypothetical protein